MTLIEGCSCTRRQLLAGGALIACWPATSAASPGDNRPPDGPGTARGFMNEAFRMKARAVGSGDQPYGAVLVRAGRIIGLGPSRVVLDSNADAHAERVAMWDAQKRTGSKDLSDSILFSTSVPCAFCQDYAARFNVAKMIHGRAMRDAGAPRRLR